MSIQDVKYVLGFDPRDKIKLSDKNYFDRIELNHVELVLSGENEICPESIKLTDIDAEILQKQDILNYLYFYTEYINIMKFATEHNMLLAFSFSKDYYNFFNGYTYTMNVSDLKTVDDLIKNNWTFLGYDLFQNEWKLSGTFGYGVREQAVIYFQENNISKINKYCLFYNFKDIEDLKHYRDLQIPEHEPHEISGIWISPISKL